VCQTLTILLAQRGHRVAVVERHAAVYDKPRAVAFDDEVARAFAAAGIAGRFADVGEPMRDYQWRNASGQTLLSFPCTGQAASDWPTGTSFTQPQLEQVLAGRAASFPNVTICRQADAVRLIEFADRVDVVAAGSVPEGTRLAASYVVGCDGANSLVRQWMDTTVTDLGFCYDWLICDIVEDEPRRWSPHGRQVCDPAPDDPDTRGAGPPALGVHADARGRPRGVRQRRERLAPARSMGLPSGQLDLGAAGGLHLPGPLGRQVARRAAVRGRRRRAPDAAVRRPGHVQRNPGRREPGMEARPRAPRALRAP
jgi:2-polyprenyl-6-methoxyphenol hydroxylase-like FAD-dependent oxidoreductase